MGDIVSTGLIGRPGDVRAIDDFLSISQTRPSGLIIEGERGTGKTTLWLAGVERARDRGFHVLAARVGQTESVLAYAAVADLLRDVDGSVLDELPDIQRVAVDHVLMRATAELPATDQHVVAAAFNSVVRRLATDAPVLIAIDDVQWLDPSSQAITAFAARRFAGPVGLLMTERCEPDCGSNTAWLQLARPDAINRIRIGPLSLGGLARLGLYAAGAILSPTDDGTDCRDLRRQPVLRARAGSRDRHRLDGCPSSAARLASRADASTNRAAGEGCTGHAADGRVRRRSDRRTSRSGHRTSVDHAADLLDEAESKGLISIDGHRVRFSHPLLARTIYTDASPAQRRAVHRQLADALLPRELKARHMASQPPLGALAI